MPSNTPSGPLIPLAMVQENETVRVVSVRTGKTGRKQVGEQASSERVDRSEHWRQRLTSMGLNIGAQVKVVQREGGNIVVLRDSARVAIGIGLSSKIMVELI